MTTDWNPLLRGEFEKPYWQQLQQFVRDERSRGVVHPKHDNERDFVVFVLWGANARRKKSLINTSRHTIIESAHPSPLSAHNGFFGSRPFSRVNAALEHAGHSAIDWSLG
ncbi:MAG: hypothetical protein EBZ46_04110 [Actinobacteria bacterium]|nr:hypothetical protein [Actinomycetota bacterium]